jgi:hypothetical protein
VSGQSDTLTQRSVHPASPDQLTRYGPLAINTQQQGSKKQPRVLTHLKFETRSKIFAYHFGALFATPAQADDGFIQMGTKMEALVIAPFMAALDVVDNVAVKYEHATRYMICQE